MYYRLIHAMLLLVDLGLLQRSAKTNTDCLHKQQRSITTTNSIWCM